jgi:hypothetical protein
MDRTLELSTEERKLFRQVLKDQLGALRQEIRHTDTRSFKDELKKTKISLEKLLDKVEEMGPISEINPPPKKTKETRLTPYA